MPELSRLPKPVTEVWDWQLRAACRGQNAAIFFHPFNARGMSRQAREEAAKAVCASCPVVAECRAHALETEEAFGVWGGLGENELRELITQQRRARPKGTEPGSRRG
ncbi:WhiB family redox-sensing transcriptional regulator [Crossiella equi]|uniref:Transcriptional regulator WhiB n=1 Tax=Crossiella equi TaxID=130796 RepID=A0ABS5AS97_9PSEU|nr:WhiB family transcriptional regulator [Crossiella equi]MBP2479443.1 WhiB family redox-sensing transcriptional regulator [Crossiella equi]